MKFPAPAPTVRQGTGVSSQPARIAELERALAKAIKQANGLRHYANELRHQAQFNTPDLDYTFETFGAREPRA